MNKPLIHLIGALVFGTAWPAFAGPDWQAIEHARQQAQAKQALRQGDASGGAASAADGRAACPDRFVPLLDHGPRAQTTPHQNELRRQRFEAQLRACRETTR